MNSKVGAVVSANVQGWTTGALDEADWPNMAELGEQAYAEVHPYAVRDLLEGHAEMGPGSVSLGGFGPDGELGGFVSACPRPLNGDDPADVWQIWYLAVAPHLRGQGLGNHLLNSLLVRLDGEASALWVWTWPHARAATATYRRAGMEILYPPGAYIYFEPTTLVLRREL